jgi:hypothetical protein
LLILEKALTFISDELDISRTVSSYDNRRACIAPYNSKVQLEYTTVTCIQEVLGAEKERGSLKFLSLKIPDSLGFSGKISNY